MLSTREDLRRKNGCTRTALGREISSGFLKRSSRGWRRRLDRKKDWISSQNRVAGKVAESRSEQT